LHGPEHLGVVVDGEDHRFGHQSVPAGSSFSRGDIDLQVDISAREPRPMDWVKEADGGSISDEAGVGVTPAPGLANLEGTDDRMLGRPGVLTGVRVLRLITTTDSATAETEAKMDPGISDGQALGTTQAPWLYLLDQGEVLTRG
jgi:hypothetical protein